MHKYSYSVNQRINMRKSYCLLTRSDTLILSDVEAVTKWR